MKISYKKKHLTINLILGLVWSVLSVANFIFDDETRILDYGFVVIALLYLGLYAYQRHYKYLSIENGIIQEGGPFGKKMEIDTIRKIKKFAGDYILKGENNKELTINTQIIDPKSLNDLDTALHGLNVEWV